MYDSNIHLQILCVEIGLVTDDEISQRESRLREALQKDTQYRVKEDSVVEVAQVTFVLKVLYNKNSSIF